MHRSIIVVPALAAVAIAQGGNTALPVTASNSAVAPCGGCIVAADVTQVIFAEYTATQTATAIVSEGQGLNGTRVSTIVTQAPIPFSATANGGLISDVPVRGNYVPLTGTVYTFNGAELTSPTAYNVFQAYTVFDFATDAAGSCTSSLQFVGTQPSPYTAIIRIGDPSTAIYDAEKAFVSAIGQITCAVGPLMMSTIVPVPAATTTVTSSTTGIFRPTPQPAVSDSVSSTSSSSSSTSTSASSAAVTTSSSSTISSSSSAAPSLSTSVNGTTTAVVTLNPSSPLVTQPIITGAAGSVYRPVYFSASILASLFMIPAIAAFML